MKLSELESRMTLVSGSIQRLLAVVGAVVALAVLASAVHLWQQSRSSTNQTQRWLGVKLPSAAFDVRCWFEQSPGTYQAELITRFRLPKEALPQLVQALRLNAADNMTGWMLPTYWYSDSGVNWWNPPKEQPERFYLNTNGVETICVWHEGYTYIRKKGGFGSPWN